MNLTLKVWRQKNGEIAGGFVTYDAKNVIPDMSFLEMLDVVNEGLIAQGEEPIAFDSDCREGICGTCSHGDQRHSRMAAIAGTTACQLHMRHFNDGETITIEPWRAQSISGHQGSGRGPRCVRPHHRRRADLSRSPPAAHRTETRFQFRRTTRKKQWTRRRASVAARASRRAKMPRRCCSFRRKFRTSRCCRRAKPNANVAC